MADLNPPAPATGRVLVSDFDGTMTRRDFYQVYRDRYLPPDAPDHWADYRAGRVTHFEALRRIFAEAAPGEPALRALTDLMGLDPDLATSLASLRQAGWRVVVVSAGCGWYIDLLFARAGVALEVHTNPGRVEGGRMLMELPVGSRYFSAETGVDKAAVVRDAAAGGGTVAFCGDGLPDVAPALLVPGRLRFARGDLAEALAERGEPFRPFEVWSEVARALLAEGDV